MKKILQIWLWAIYFIFIYTTLVKFDWENGCFPCLVWENMLWNLYIPYYFTPTTLKKRILKIKKTPADIDQMKKVISQIFNLGIFRSQCRKYGFRNICQKCHILTMHWTNCFSPSNLTKVVLYEYWIYSSQSYLEAFFSIFQSDQYLGH